jgi:uncharacterized cupin superfamily protein
MSDNVVALDLKLSAETLEATDSVPSDGLISGVPNTRGADLFTRDDLKASAGIWTCDTYDEYIPSFPYDELILVIEGSVTLTEEGHEARTFGPGDVFAIRRGTACGFAVTGPFRKLYMNYDVGA